VELKAAFGMVNASEKAVSVEKVYPSCGCISLSKAHLPLLVLPGKKAAVELTIDVMGKRGSFRKELRVVTSEGEVTLAANVALAETPPETRIGNQLQAAQDRQRVFQGNCAECHADPIGSQMAGRLFTTACAICHLAPHRAEMVPRLPTSDPNRGPEYWRRWIEAGGGEGTLMPAFAAARGGPLSEAQVDSLVRYLLRLPDRAQEENDLPGEDW
jgi:mono/diheme cytochrome c family protein